MKKAGIIGGSGFIGSYITKRFLEEKFKIKVSTTDISKKEKYQHLKNLKNSIYLEIKQLDVENIIELEAFIKDCEIIVHCGTPFKLDVENPQKELFDPTIKGTENFLMLVKNSPCIEKVVFVASVAAYNTNFPFPAADKGATDIFTETDEPYYNEENNPYAQAKFIANKTVDKFIVENPDIGFEIVSISPVAVMGKALSNREDSTAVGLQFLFKNKIAPNRFIELLYEQDVTFAMVDVADVAESAYKASIIKGNHGKNYLISSDSWKVSDISLMLNNLPPEGKPHIVYSSILAKKELGIQIKPSQVPLNKFGSFDNPSLN